MNYDMIERFLIVMFAMFGAFVAFAAIGGTIALCVHIYDQFNPEYSKKVEEEKHYIAKCKSVNGVFITTNDTRYCYKDGKVIEIE